jgi:hypothetical protein
MALQFEGMGLQPAGDTGTSFQNVPFRSLRIDTTNTTLAITRDGKSETLVFGKDFLNEPDAVRSQLDVNAPIVFVGYGVTALEQKRRPESECLREGHPGECWPWRHLANLVRQREARQ